LEFIVAVDLGSLLKLSGLDELLRIGQLVLDPFSDCDQLRILVVKSGVLGSNLQDGVEAFQSFSLHALGSEEVSFLPVVERVCRDQMIQTFKNLVELIQLVVDFACILKLSFFFISLGEDEPGLVETVISFNGLKQVSDLLGALRLFLAQNEMSVG